MCCHRNRRRGGGPPRHSPRTAAAGGGGQRAPAHAQLRCYQPYVLPNTALTRSLADAPIDFFHAEVGAVSLRATLNCDAFATEHSGESHFDRSSFVGLAVNFVWIRTLYTSTLVPWRIRAYSPLLYNWWGWRCTSTGNSPQSAACTNASIVAFSLLLSLWSQWRPPREKICCEIYSTGRANLPGSVAERQLLSSFSRMLPG